MQHIALFYLRWLVVIGAPVVLLAMVKSGSLNSSKLKSVRPYVIVVNLILGAVLTTPDLFTQIIMAAFLQLVFETVVWVAGRWERKAKKSL